MRAEELAVELEQMRQTLTELKDSL